MAEQALLDRLKRYSKHCLTQHTDPDFAEAVYEAVDVIDGLLNDLQEALDTVEELQSQLPKWIPVTERLPNGESDRYLVAYGFMSHLRVAICYYADNLETDNGFYAYDDEHGFHGKTEARYWMPLPEPPKEETDG